MQPSRRRRLLPLTCPTKHAKGWMWAPSRRVAGKKQREAHQAPGLSSSGRFTSDMAAAPWADWASAARTVTRRLITYTYTQARFEWFVYYGLLLSSSFVDEFYNYIASSDLASVRLSSHALRLVTYYGARRENRNFQSMRSSGAHGTRREISDLDRSRSRTMSAPAVVPREPVGKRGTPHLGSHRTRGGRDPLA